MLSRLILVTLFTFSFGIEWVDYNGYKIDSKLVVIKVKKDVALYL